MRIAITFFALLVLSCVFLILKDSKTALEDQVSTQPLTSDQIEWSQKYFSLRESGYYQDLFLFSDTKISLRTYAYDLSMHVFIIVLLWLLLERHWAGEYPYTKSFLFLQIGDFLDYLLTHNEAYISVISLNVLSPIIYGSFAYLYSRSHTRLD